MHKPRQIMTLVFTIILFIVIMYATISIFMADTCDKPIQYMTGRQLSECNN